MKTVKGDRDLAGALRVYLVTDTTLAGDGGLYAAVEAALEAGVGCLQYRDQQAPTRIMLERARRLLEIARRHGVFLLVNDRVDVALAVGADGVHVGGDDMPVGDARRLLGPEAIIGATARTPQTARRAAAQGADYLGAGPVFATTTKPGIGVLLGERGLAGVVRSVSVPVVGIGGVTVENAPRVIAAGAAGVAVVSEIMAARNPGKRARELARAVDHGEV